MSDAEKDTTASDRPIKTPQGEQEQAEKAVLKAGLRGMHEAASKLRKKIPNNIQRVL